MATSLRRTPDSGPRPRRRPSGPVPLFVASLKYAGVAVGAVLSSTAPLFALPLGVLFLGERASAWTVLGVLVAVAGIIVLQA